MPGRAPWSTPENSPDQTMATQERPNVVVKDDDIQSEIAAGNAVTKEVYAPTDSMYRLQGLRFAADAPPSATSGYHQLELEQAGAIIQMLIRSNYDEGILHQGVAVRSGGSQKKMPGSEDARATALLAMIADEDTSMSFTYTNDTDAASDSYIGIRWLFEEVSF